MRSTRRTFALAACLAISLGTFALPTRPLGAQGSTTYSVVDAYNADVTVNGSAAQIGANYQATDEVAITPTAPGASVVIAQTVDGGVPTLQTTSQATAGQFQAVWIDQLIWTGE